jgi:protein-tyrosine phosphatase
VVELYRVAWPGPGGLAVAGRPRGGDWLAGDMRAFRAAGVEVLVSALVPEEQRELWLEDEAREASLAKIEFLALPIPNLLVPDRAVAAPIVEQLAAYVTRARFVAAHCRAGIGRSPLIVAAVLVGLGLAPDDAWAAVERARGLAVPDTHEQRAWVAGFAAPRPLKTDRLR